MAALVQAGRPAGAPRPASGPPRRRPIPVARTPWPWLAPRLAATLGLTLVLTVLLGACTEPTDTGFLPVRRSYPDDAPSDAALRLEASELPRGKSVLRLGITPFESLERTRADLQPLAAMIGAMLGVPIEVQPAQSYESLVQAVSKGEVDIALLSPASYVHARRQQPRLHLVGRAITQGVSEYAAFIVVRASDPLYTLADLRGKRMAWVDRMSASGYIYPFGAFRRQGLVPDQLFSQQQFYGTHDLALNALLRGEADACAVASGTFERLVTIAGTDRPRAALRILHKTGRIPFDALVVSAEFSPDAARRIGWAFRNVSSRNAAGRAALASTWGWRGWIPADDAAYDGARRVMDEVARLPSAALPLAALPRAATATATAPAAAAAPAPGPHVR